ncbi:Protein-lysine N-methyltransferase EFM4 [Cladobotryum mycophilum]|uniref:Protein-lysine N-methyltransferase EFM4 n=1 Tax=Cladobotryum mycophilum TaxID=491253 RepID=A0ABR0S9L6_9HYPO
MASRPAHLEPWNNLYTTELSNHAADPFDIGTCWFEDSDAESHNLDFLASLADDAYEEPAVTLPSPLPRSSTSFLDLGCGNGALLFSLRDDGWQGRMLGVDYSPQSKTSRIRRMGPPVRPLVHPLNNHQSTGWDLVLDKGTFDAISLSSATDSQGRRLVESYRERMLRLLKPDGGLFLVTSCNWTEEELKGWFEGKELRVVGKVDYPTFTFGGAKGQTISTLCFQRA